MILPLDSINALLKTRTGLEIVRMGQDHEAPPLPYIQYSKVTDTRLKDYQIFKEYSEAASPEIEYKNTTNQVFEYSTVNDPSDSMAAMTILTNLYNFLTTDEFRLAMKRINVGHTIMTDITEVRINKESFSERWFRFELRYMWADVFKFIEGTFIETIVPARTSP